jgi:molybdopterin converting factor small subunit
VKVTVDYLGSIRQTLSLKQAEQVELESGSAVSNLLSVLAEKHGEPFQKAVYEPKDLDLKAHYILSVNGLLLNQLDGIRTKLKDGDRLVLMPSFQQRQPNMAYWFFLLKRSADTEKRRDQSLRLQRQLCPCYGGTGPVHGGNG